MRNLIIGRHYNYCDTVIVRIIENKCRSNETYTCVVHVIDIVKDNCEILRDKTFTWFVLNSEKWELLPIDDDMYDDLERILCNTN